LRIAISKWHELTTLMRVRTVLLGALVCASVGCSRQVEESPSGATNGATNAAPHPPPGLTGSVAVKGPVDRAKAEKIGLFYARVHWPGYKPALATAFNTGDGEYRVVVGFDRRPDAASVFVRIEDGEVVDASIAPGDY
jgi:hypothetical protein